MSGLSPSDQAYQEAHIHQNRGPMVVRTTIALIVITTVAVVLRLVARKAMRIALGWDDLFCVLGLIFFLCMCAINFVAVHFGMGRHLLATNPADGYKIIEAGFFLSIDYALTQFCIKMGLLFLYIRIFTLRNKWFKFAVWFVMFYVTSWAISLIVAACTQCHPLDYFWTQYDEALSPPAKGHCPVHSTPLVISTSALNTAADFMLLFLPMPMLLTLHLPIWRKIGLVSIFAVGIFACVAGILRLTTTLTSINSSSDSTWNTAEVYIWTAVEAAVQLWCACCPVFAPLLVIVQEKVTSVVSSSLGSRFSSWNRSQDNSMRSGFSTKKGPNENMNTDLEKQSDEQPRDPWSPDQSATPAHQDFRQHGYTDRDEEY